MRLSCDRLQQFNFKLSFRGKVDTPSLPLFLNRAVPTCIFMQSALSLVAKNLHVVASSNCVRMHAVRASLPQKNEDSGGNFERPYRRKKTIQSPLPNPCLLTFFNTGSQLHESRLLFFLPSDGRDTKQKEKHRLNR